MNRRIICALDTSELGEAIKVVHRLREHVVGFKIGHALTLANGLEVIKLLQEEGAGRIFLDLKFHDIPNSVALAVCEAAKYNVWMMTLHVAGGPAMLNAAVEEARSCGEDQRPLLVGVCVLTSIDQRMMSDFLGVERTIEDQKVRMAELATDCGLDGVVCATPELRAVRKAIGHSAVIITPGIRLPSTALHDQLRTGDPKTALADGADYLVMGRALTACSDVGAALAQLQATVGTV